MIRPLLARALPALSLLSLAGSIALAAPQSRKSYRLPAEAAVALPPGPDADLVEAQCSACHSLDYLQTQPRQKGAKFWQDAVTKMINVYGAPIEAEDARRISAYLERTYG